MDGREKEGWKRTWQREGGEEPPCKKCNSKYRSQHVIKAQVEVESQSTKFNQNVQLLLKSVFITEGLVNIGKREAGGQFSLSV